MIEHFGGDNPTRLRYELKPGSTTYLSLHSEAETTYVSPKNPTVGSEGRADLLEELTVTGQTTDGNHEVRVRFLRKTRAGMVPVTTGNLTVTPRGLLAKEASFEPALDTLDEHERALVEHGVTITPFPEEAVGIGGKWKSQRRVVDGNLILRETRSYELVERGENGPVIESTAVYGVLEVKEGGWAPTEIDRIGPGIAMQAHHYPGLLVSKHIATRNLEVQIGEDKVTRMRESHAELLGLSPLLPMALRRPDLPFEATFQAGNACAFEVTDAIRPIELQGAGGRIVTRGSCKLGLPEAEWIQELAEIGTLRMTFQNGQLDGPWAQEAVGKELGSGKFTRGTGSISLVTAAGQPLLSARFQKGQPDGPIITFHPSGRRHITGQFKQGWPVGPWKWWRDDSLATEPLIYREYDALCDFVHYLVPDGPAATAGMQLGDQVISVNRERFRSAADLTERTSKGKPLRITFRRDGVSKTLTITPEARFGSPPRLGLTLGCSRKLKSALGAERSR